MQFSRTTRSKSSHARRGPNASSRTAARSGPRQAGLFDLLDSVSSTPAASGAEAAAGIARGAPIELGKLSLRELQTGVVGLGLGGGGHRSPTTRRPHGDQRRMQQRGRTGAAQRGVETPARLEGADPRPAARVLDARELETPDSAEPIVVRLGDVIGVLGVAIAMACCVMAAVFA